MVVMVASGGLGAGTPWTLFGDATVVRSGQSPNPLAVQLRSDPAPGFGGVDFAPPVGGMTFGEIFHLSTDSNVTDDDCVAGSPRFQLNMDANGDGDFDGNMFAYIGPSPNFTSCSAGWQSTGNLIGNNDTGRYDTSQLFSGTQVNTYSGALALGIGSMTVLGIQLVVDSGFAFADGEQTILVDNIRINQFRLTAQGVAP